MLVVSIQLLLVLLPFALIRWLRPTEGCLPAPDFHQFPIMLRALGGLRQYPRLYLVSVLLHFALAALTLIPLRFVWPPPSAEHWRLGGWLFVLVPTLLPALLAPGALTPLRRGRVTTPALSRAASVAQRRASLSAVVVATLAVAPVGCAIALERGLLSLGGPDRWMAGWIVILAGVVAGLAVLSALCLAPILSVDRPVSLRAALRGALDLSHGYRARLLGVHMLFLWLGGFLLAWFADRWPEPRPSDFVFVLLMGALLWAVYAVTLVIIYHRLRGLKYGDDTAQLAEVFR